MFLMSSYNKLLKPTRKLIGEIDDLQYEFILLSLGGWILSVQEQVYLGIYYKVRRSF